MGFVGFLDTLSLIVICNPDGHNPGFIIRLKYRAQQMIEKLTVMEK